MTTDLVTCGCNAVADRSVFAQCPGCGMDLWDLVAPTEPTSEDTHESESAMSPRTVIDRPSARRRVGHVVIGSRDTLDITADDVLLLGRDDDYPQAAIFAQYPNLSRRHGILRFDGSCFHVTDTGSANGIFIEGVRINPQTEYEVRPGQVVRLAADVSLDLQID
ncbi:FHA domain-containing protein [Rhodococcus sp. KBS0724]|uniref:FHA domain-containing protein n=1 Tax=Rhodococcus sp. KBS0724 TaxID=1179674 RepID=UPI00110EF4F1|nr:FHA domain-containing protein [Rhodococcus sp. KBS0724]TSD44746.1 FHA domain-containing protein [Rhodococcus sp. KBS0724]